MSTNDVPLAGCVPLRNRKRQIVAWASVDDDDLDRVLANGPWHLGYGGYVRHSVSPTSPKLYSTEECRVNT